MANLLVDYTVLNSQYQKGKFRFIKGDNTVPSIDDPEDTGINDIRPYQDPDPTLFSYLNGSAPRALLVNITTSAGTSTGKYTACVPVWDSAKATYTWDYLRDSGNNPLAKDVALVDNGGNPVAGNPYGIVKIGNNLFIVDYDTVNIYRVGISAFERTAAGGNCRATPAANAAPYLPSGFTASHGAAVISLVSGGITYLYALFTATDARGYMSSAIVRYEVATTLGNLSNAIAVWVGPNAVALVPVTSGTNNYILVPAIGGDQNNGNTNGTASNLTAVNAVSDFVPTTPITTVPPIITGDSSTTVTPTGNYDFMGVAVSPDGANAYILLNTYDANYQSCWRLYKSTLSAILNGGGAQISQVSGLTSVDNGFSDPAGYYWEVLYDSTVTGGRLWFLKGSPIRVSAGGAYSPALKEIGDILYGPGGVNVNSADLIGEMLYQADQGAAINTRLGTTRQLAKAAQAAKAAQEEENK